MNKEYIVEGKIVDIINKEIYEGKIYISDGHIKKILRSHSLKNNYILPGLINSHVHIESTMLTPESYGEIALKHGTVAVLSDPHEIANVCGIEGIDFMISNSKNSPLKFYFGLPSCVPATENETSGYKIDSTETEKLLSRNDIFFLAEMMNFPGVVYSDEEVLKKIGSAKKHNKKIDGHAPGLGGNALIRYANSGISTDHECMNIEEAISKIKLGIKIQIREGSAAKNFESLFQLIDIYPEIVMLCTDDSHPDDLILGHINEIVKRAISKKLDIFNILRASSLNPIKHYNLDVGLLQTGDKADFIVVDDLTSFNILETHIDGIKRFDIKENKITTKTKYNTINNFNCHKIEVTDILVENISNKIKVIDVIDGELFTKCIQYSHYQKTKYISSNSKDDILKIVVVNRYIPSKPSIGFIRGFGLKSGAIAESISHDSHNIICVGNSDSDIITAINKIIDNKGGMVVCLNNKIDFLELEIAGLMTNKNVYEVANKYDILNIAAKNLGSKLNSPFMTLSFMSLLVIPELKISDKYLFDGVKFEPTSIYIKE